MNKSLSKVCCFLCIICLLVPVLSSCGQIDYAVVSEGNTCDGFVYTLYENGNAVITSGTATSDGKLIIPVTVDGHKVSGIADGAFRDRTDFIYLEIGGKNISLGSNSFYACNALTVAVLTGVSEVGTAAFYMCQNLTYIKGTENITSIGNAAFCGCLSLSLFSFGEKLVSIGNSAFDGCCSLSSVTLPSALKTMGESVFSSCSSLAYADISSLKEIPYGTFVKCTRLSRIIFSDSLKSVGEQAFRSCQSLCTVTVPKSLKTVAASAFGDCTSLDTVNYTGSEGAWNKIDFSSGNEALAARRPYCKYKESKGKYEKYDIIADRGTPEGSYTSGSFTYSLFEDGCARITGFNGATAILELPKALDGHTVVSVGEAAFSENSTLSSLVIPDSVEEICDAAFYNDTALSVVSGAENLKSVGNKAFGGTLWLSNNSSEYITLGPVLIEYKGSCSSVTLPSGIGYIGDAAFSNNTLITCADLGNSVVSIGNQAFAFCENLSCIIAPSVTYIGVNAFTSCEALTAADTGNPSYIGKYAFADCNGLRYVCVGNCIENLSGYVFYSCINLRVFCMPYSLKSLDADCFNDGTPFTVLYPGTQEEYLSAITGEGTQNLSDMFVFSSWEK